MSTSSPNPDFDRAARSAGLRAKPNVRFLSRQDVVEAFIGSQCKLSYAVVIRADLCYEQNIDDISDFLAPYFKNVLWRDYSDEIADADVILLPFAERGPAQAAYEALVAAHLAYPTTLVTWPNAAQAYQLWGLGRLIELRRKPNHAHTS